MQAWSFQGFKFRSRDSITVLVSPSFVLEKTSVLHVCTFADQNYQHSQTAFIKQDARIS